RSEKIASSDLMCVTLLARERGHVRRVLECLALVVASGVLRDRDRTIENAHHGLRRDERERFLHRGMRNRVVVEIEPDVGRLTRTGRDHAFAGEGMLGQGQQPWALLLERLFDAAT